jgi:hypothetical protein
MKITYEFDTTSENFDRYEYERIRKSLDMALALYDIDSKIRGWRKYDERDTIPVDEITDMFVGVLDNRMINLDDILE